jgi:hypothetical protein
MGRDGTISAGAIATATSPEIIRPDRACKGSGSFVAIRVGKHQRKLERAGSFSTGISLRIFIALERTRCAKAVNNTEAL